MVHIPELQLNDKGLPPSSPPEPSSPPVALHDAEMSDTEQRGPGGDQNPMFVVVGEGDVDEAVSDEEPPRTIAIFSQVEWSISEDTNPCRGQAVRWTGGSVWSTYAFQQHEDENFLWRPIGFRGDNILVLRSKHCLHALITEKERSLSTCNRCGSLLFSHTLDAAVSRSKEAKPHTPYKYLSMSQLSKVTRAKREDNLQLRNEVR
jgi:hypothetical protein